MGAWFEAKIVALSLKDGAESTVLYHVQYEEWVKIETTFVIGTVPIYTCTVSYTNLHGAKSSLSILF